MGVAEIARKAKVSPATVSRVINRPETVSPERVKAVHEAMQALQFTPAMVRHRRPPLPRQAKHGEVKEVGIWFVGTHRSPNLNWLQEQLLQIRQSTLRYQLHLSVFVTETANELPSAISRRAVDGLIIQGMEPSPACRDKLRSVPNVWLMTRRSEDYDGDFVEPDNKANAALALRHLSKQGHQELAILTTDPKYSAIHKRVEYFQHFALKQGIKARLISSQVDRDSSYLSPSPIEGEIESLVQRLVKTSPRPTGLYLPSDHFCGTFFRLLKKHKLVPGQDFEVILGNFTPVIYYSLDHLPAAIDINLRTIVHKAVDQLFWRMENINAPGRIGIKVTPQLVTPESPRPNLATHPAYL